MKPQQQLDMPVRKIEGTDFLVDVSRGELRQIDRPDNTISFGDMTDKGTHYELLYDKGIKNIPKAYTRNSMVVKVNLLPMTQLHPEGMAAVYGVRRTGIEQRKDADIIRNNKLYKERLDGKLPTIEVLGRTYDVHIDIGQLRAHQKGVRDIDLRQFELDDEGKLKALFDLRKDKVATLNLERLTELPKEVVMLVLPGPSELDPVGTAIKYSMPSNSLIHRYPINPALKAQVIPLEQTTVARIVKLNQQGAPEKPDQKVNRRGLNRGNGI